MKVVVLGGGVIGVSTAYFLAKAGHSVMVLERQPGVADETSFANAGEISPGYSAPWAGPGVPLKAIKWLLMEHSPLVIKLSPDFRMWRWLFMLLANCNQKRYHINKSRMLRIALYSQVVLADLLASESLAFDHRAKGTLQLFRSQKQLDSIGKDLQILEQFDTPYQVLDRQEVALCEPALKAVAEKYVGGLHLPGDETGDCHLFTRALAAKAEAEGVEFRCDTTVVSIKSKDQHIDSIQTDAGDEITADAFVVALGSYSPGFLKTLGIKIPVYPVKGYSLTVPIKNPQAAPESTVMDETHKVAVTRLGDRIRLGGTAELAGFNLDIKEKRLRTLYHVLNDLFPEGGYLNEAEPWAGLRPMTPDGTPIIGKTAIENLFLNTGHGTLGWTMGPGSGKLLADIISGNEPEIDLDGFGVSRYSCTS
ncbi:MAG: D-amino acid dehydrogenase [Thiotrichales bacterium]